MLVLEKVIRAAIAVALIGSPCSAEGPPWRVEGVVIEKATPLDQAFAQGKAAGRDFSSLERSLERMLTSGDSDDRRVAVGWVTTVDGRFSFQEQETLLRRCRGLLPGAYAPDIDEALVRLHWRESTQDERRQIYWDAVKFGNTKIWEGRELDRATALVLAAGEGLEEFSDAARQFGFELDDPRDRESPPAAERLRLRMKLRSGARDTLDADRLQGERLGEMGDEEFARVMKSDLVFRYVTITFSNAVCDRPNSDACRSVGAVALRQEKMWAQASVSTSPRGSSGVLATTAKPEWLQRLSEAAAPGKTEVYLEQAKTAIEKAKGDVAQPKK